MARHGQIFISYRRELSTAQTDAIARELKRIAPRVQVFVDRETLQLGDPWRTRIEREIIASDLMLVLIPRGWENKFDLRPDGELVDPNDPVEAEIATGFRHGCRIAPIRIDRSDMPAASALPRNVQPLLDLHSAELRLDGDDRRNLQEIAANIVKRLDAIRPPSRRDLRRTALASGSIGAAMGFALCFALFAGIETHVSDVAAAEPEETDVETATVVDAPIEPPADADPDVLLLGASQAPASASAPRETFRPCDACPELIVLPPAAGADRLIAFGVAETTRAEYGAFAAATGRPAAQRCRTYEDGVFETRMGRSWRSPGFVQSDDEPVLCVSVDDAEAYVAWLNEQVDGEPFRLPTDAEQTHALRAGAFGAYPWPGGWSDGCAFANVHDRASLPVNAFTWAAAECDDGHARLAAVDALRSNAFGLRHMSGNVWEWSASCWDDAAGAAFAPTADRPCLSHVLRGGSWLSHPNDLEIEARDDLDPGSRYVSVGFRVAYDIAP